MGEATINVKACELLKNGKVAVRLQVLQERVAAKAVLTRQWVLEQLMDNVTKAKGKDDYTASNKALELLGKTDEIGGMFIERSNVTSDNRHHHSAQPLSPFAEFIAGAITGRAKDAPEEPIQN